MARSDTASSSSGHRFSLLCLCLLIALALPVYGAYPELAGKGSTYPYFLASPSGDQQDTRGFQEDRDYISIEAVCWYANLSSTSLRRKTVSGTVSIGFGAAESYTVCLGQYSAEGGQRVAPIFQTPIIPTRPYTGEMPRIQLFLKGVERDTALGGVLKNLAGSSLEIAKAAQTVTAASPARALLVNAGDGLVKSLQGVLSTDTAPVTIFDQQVGIDLTLRKDNVLKPVTYLLCHRGSPLQRDGLQVIEDANQMPEIRYHGAPLTDGAWVLLRISRVVAYEGDRPSKAVARKARGRLDALMDICRTDPSPARLADAGKRLTFSADFVDKPNEADQVRDAWTQIDADPMLTYFQRVHEKGQLQALLMFARQAVQAGKPDQYVERRERLYQDLCSGKLPGEKAVATLFIDKAVNGLLDRALAEIARSDQKEFHIEQVISPEEQAAREARARQQLETQLLETFRTLPIERE